MGGVRIREGSFGECKHFATALAIISTRNGVGGRHRWDVVGFRRTQTTTITIPHGNYEERDALIKGSREQLMKRRTYLHG